MTDEINVDWSLFGDEMVTIECLIQRAKYSIGLCQTPVLQSRIHLGMTATMMIDENGLTGWIDPRGLETRIESTPTDIRIEQSGLRTWNMSHERWHVNRT